MPRHASWLILPLAIACAVAQAEKRNEPPVGNASAQPAATKRLVPLPRVSGPVELRVLKGGAPVGDPVSVEAKAP